MKRYLVTFVEKTTDEYNMNKQLAHFSECNVRKVYGELSYEALLEQVKYAYENDYDAFELLLEGSDVAEMQIDLRNEFGEYFSEVNVYKAQYGRMREAAVKVQPPIANFEYQVVVFPFNAPTFSEDGKTFSPKLIQITKNIAHLNDQFQKARKNPNGGRPRTRCFTILPAALTSKGQHPNIPISDIYTFIKENIGEQNAFKLAFGSNAIAVADVDLAHLNQEVPEQASTAIPMDCQLMTDSILDALKKIPNVNFQKFLIQPGALQKINFVTTSNLSDAVKTSTQGAGNVTDNVDLDISISENAEFANTFTETLTQIKQQQVEIEARQKEYELKTQDIVLVDRFLEALEISAARGIDATKAMNGRYPKPEKGALTELYKAASEKAALEDYYRRHPGYAQQDAAASFVTGKADKSKSNEAEYLDKMEQDIRLRYKDDPEKLQQKLIDFYDTREEGEATRQSGLNIEKYRQLTKAQHQRHEHEVSKELKINIDTKEKLEQIQNSQQSGNNQKTMKLAYHGNYDHLRKLLKASNAPNNETAFGWLTKIGAENGQTEQPTGEQPTNNDTVGSKA